MKWWKQGERQEWWHNKPIQPPSPPRHPAPPKAPSITGQKITSGGINTTQMQKPKGMRYERGARVDLHDSFDHEWLNDVAKYIEALEDRIEKLEKRVASPCAQCDDFAAEDDYLCRACRATQDEA